MSPPPLLVLLVLWSGVGLVASLLLDHRQRLALLAQRRDPAAVADAAPAEVEKAAAYGLARLRAGEIEAVLDFALGLAALLFGYDLASRIAASLLPAGIGRSLLIVLLLWLAASLFQLPLEAWRTLVLEQRFGFNRTSRAGFVRDTLLSSLLTLLIGGVLLGGLFLVMQRLHGLWWLYAWAVLSVLSVVAGPIYLRLIAPLFNRFTPLRPAVAAPVAALLARTGFRAAALLEMDASKRSSRGNAYVMGIGPAKRIVLFDTLLDQHPPDEVAAVVAHELGHVHHRHILTGTARGIVLLLGLCIAVGYLSQTSQLQPGFGIRHPDPALGLLLSLLLVGIAQPIVSLAGNAVSRRHEYQADAYAGDQVGVMPMIAALLRLSRDNASVLVPDRLYSLVHHTHPPVSLRVARLRGPVSNQPAAGA